MMADDVQNIDLREETAIDGTQDRVTQPDIMNSTGTTLMHRKSVIEEAIRYLSIYELRSIAFLSKFHSRIVRNHYSYRLSRLLKHHLVYGNFTRMMKKYNIVISGSSVWEFMDPALTASWAKLGVPANDLDLYVKRGRIEPVVRYLCRQSGVASSVVFSSHESIIGDRWIVNNIAVDTDEKYEVNGIKSVVKIKLVRGSKTRYVDVIESSCDSPILPIVHFDLSICRNALMVDGLAVYHADWTFKNISYLCPMVSSSASPEAVAALRVKTVARTEKYAKRGVMIYQDVRVSPRMKDHTCAVETSCPHTLRNTGDSGVYFLPFFPMSVDEKRKCKSARCEPVMWRCGGPSCSGVTDCKSACAFRAPYLHDKYEGELIPNV